MRDLLRETFVVAAILVKDAIVVALAILLLRLIDLWGVWVAGENSQDPFVQVLRTLEGAFVVALYIGLVARDLYRFFWR